MLWGHAPSQTKRSGPMYSCSVSEHTCRIGWPGAGGVPMLKARTCEPSRQRDCHFTGIPSPSILKNLLKGEGGAAE